jgi:hypothetical protein
MNERIEKLKKQAWEYTMAVHDGHIVPPLDKEVWPVDKVFDEKFAELIVRECASMARVFQSNEYDFTGDLDLDEFMLKHFGVE